MNAARAPLEDHDLRAVPRTGLFLSAIVQCGAQRLSARIRNLSISGAQVELVGLPDHCFEVALIRAHLSVAASIAWRKQGRCGLKFERPIVLEEWIPSLANERQMKADRRIDGIRKGIVGPSGAIDRPNQLQVRISEELGMAERQIGQALDELASFAPLVSRLPQPLQNLEIISQTLGHLARLLCNEDPAAIIDSLGMEDLKRRLLR